MLDVIIYVEKLTGIIFVFLVLALGVLGIVSCMHSSKLSRKEEECNECGNILDEDEK